MSFRVVAIWKVKTRLAARTEQAGIVFGLRAARRALVSFQHGINE